MNEFTLIGCKGCGDTEAKLEAGKRERPD